MYLLTFTGFTVKSNRKKKKPKRQKVTREDSDDDKEWTPGCEDNRRTRGEYYLIMGVA